MDTGRHLIDEWHDELLVELRLREVPGQRIGDVLAEVDDHCAATGEAPEEAFGDPREYGAAVASALGAARRPAWRVALVGLAGVTAVLAVLDGAAAVATGRPVEVSEGELTAVALAALGVPTVFLVLDRTRGRAAAAAIAAAVFTAMVVPQVLWPATVATAPAWPVLLAGVAGLVAAFRPDPAARVVDPRTGREPFAARRVLTVLSWAPAVLLAVAVAVAVLVPVD